MNLENIFDFISALKSAAELGYNDYVNGRYLGKGRTGKQICDVLRCENYRIGHLRYLRSAYQAGKFNAKIEKIKEMRV